MILPVGYVGNITAELPHQRHLPRGPAAPREAMLRVALKTPGPGATTGGPRAERLRKVLSERMPAVRFSFEPADIVSEVMSFGSPTPVEVSITGPSLADDRAHAEKVKAALGEIPALRDLQYVQALDYPTIKVELDRELAGISGVTAAEVARSLVVWRHRRAASSCRTFGRIPRRASATRCRSRSPSPRWTSDQPHRDDPHPEVRR